jgi:hypothetical protein
MITPVEILPAIRNGAQGHYTSPSSHSIQPRSRDFSSRTAPAMRLGAPTLFPLSRVSPTTPTQFPMSLATSVDPTEARKDAGHSHAAGGTELAVRDAVGTIGRAEGTTF